MGRRGRNTHPRSRDSAGWVEITKDNAEFVAYYQKQEIINDPAEWDKFYEACKRQLPVTFRFTGTSDHDSHKVRDALVKEYIPILKNIVVEGEEVEAPSPLPWYPDELAWQIRVGKTVIRKSKPFARFQKFLVTETDVGNISRQEAVSMIPPLVLDVKPEHAVIDLCAAPGSKTAQLIEAVHSIPEPTGVVIANDSDHKRSHMLIHQVKRLNSPNLIVTNHDAQLYPRIKVGETTNTDGRVDPVYLKYDRVLCDVPCSGDGTMRKNINVWRDWTPFNGLGLHQIQINILQRGLNLLRDGGRLVYSTCSLNPVENEAVVADAIRTWKGRVKIVNCDSMLPGLIRRKGMKHWSVMGKDRKWTTTPSKNVAESCFSRDDLEELGIENCMRVYPHDQDTGAFFIAVLEKDATGPEASSKRKREEDGKAESEVLSKAAKLDADTEAVAGLERTETAALVTETEDGDELASPAVAKLRPGPKKKERLPRDANEEPFKFLPADHAALENCWSFYSISPDFPRYSFLVRNATGEPVRTIYYVQPRLHDIISMNDTKIKFIHAGIKLFAFQKTLEGSCPWRVQSEGLAILYRHVKRDDETSRVVSCNLTTLETLCQVTFPKFAELKDKEFVEQVKKQTEGCMFLEVATGIEGDAALVFPLWRGKGSVNLMLPKQDAEELLLRVFKSEEPIDTATKTGNRVGEIDDLVIKTEEAETETNEAIDGAPTVTDLPEVKTEDIVAEESATEEATDATIAAAEASAEINEEATPLEKPEAASA
ncbi:S-adenosyl-L-methionine-dependent methyltransferase [Limtongia smithiae]|uniref:S-adenosyl-L-methionine-dependent methyltransferase n=1 Tax=Limtongia smithiae TaxID=1125753 RepID=UPI0034CF9D84